ncbi:MAG: dTDP-4-dehydrorhamnose 3,5-epimerase family protein, partial [Acidimicrobiia bacterium]
PIVDERGAFARVFATDEFAARGVDPGIAQMSLATNSRRGTLRGMHLQLPPHAESKLVRCIRGSAYDVVVDLRPDSATFLAWTGVTLDAQSRVAVSIPEGVAHGYLTVEDDTEMEYLISAAYEPAAAVGVRWNDPTIGVAWPFEPTVIGDRDRAFPDLDRDRLASEGLSALRTQGAQP